MDICPICKKEFKRKYIKKGQRKVCCSKQCRYKYVQSKIPISTCKTCGKEFRAHQLRQYKEYCSLSCIQRTPCQFCGKIITGRVTFQSGNKRFCGRKCATAFRRINQREKNYIVRGFIQTIQRCGDIICEKCGHNVTESLNVHHIDENKRNNETNNLMTLCANCHYALHRTGSVRHSQNVSTAHFFVDNFLPS